jgi:hypothetical protein
MKLLILLSFALVIGMAQTFADDKSPNDLGTVTIADKTYNNLHVTEVTDLGIKCTWDGGLGLITFDSMPADMQKKFGYDPNKFKQAATQQAQHDAQSDSAASAQAKVDEANLAKRDADAATQAAAISQPRNAVVKGAKYLAGKVLKNVTGGYAVYIAPYEAPTVSYMQSIGGGGGRSYGPVNPYPAIGYDMTVILKTDKVHTVDESVSIPVMEAGTYKGTDGNDYKAYTELSSQ